MIRLTVEHRMIQTHQQIDDFIQATLKRFVARALTAVGLPGTDAEQVARLMILPTCADQMATASSAYLNTCAASEPAE